MDSSVHFAITESGVSRFTGKGWSITKKVAKGLSSVLILRALLTGKVGYGPAALSQHYLTGKSADKEFMRWKDIRKVTVDDESHVVSLYGDQETQLRICCTTDIFETILTLIRK